MDSHYDTQTKEETARPLHSFGGRALDRYVFDYEAAEGGTPALDVGAAVVDPPDAAAVAVPVVEPLTREEILAAATEAAQAGSSEAFRAFAAEAEAAEARRVAAIAPDLPDYDPYEPSSVLAHVMAEIAPQLARIEQMLAPALEATSTYQAERGEVQARALLDGLKTGEGAVGEFDSDRAIDRARVLNSQGMAPEEALRQAAKDERAHVQSIEAAYAARMGVVAEAHAAAGGEVASGGAAAGEVTTLPKGKNGYTEQLKRSLASRGLRPGVGAGTG